MRAWLLWEAIWTPHLRPLRDGGLIRYSLGRHHGPQVDLQDGATVRRGDRLVELHLDNRTLLRLATGGFDPKYFLYFEDYDWSVRLNKVTQTVYLPSFRAVHHGGHAARKGIEHVGWFVKSGMRFYNKHGWRWF